MIKRIIQKIKTRKIGKNAIIFYLPDEKKSRLRAFARTRAKNFKNQTNVILLEYVCEGTMSTFIQSYYMTNGKG